MTHTDPSDLGKLLDTFVATNRISFEAALTKLVNIPTVSADPARKADISRGAEFVALLLTDAGFTSEVADTPGNPVVLGHLVQDPTYPTVIIYNHLDVQPADPAEWATSPFTLTIKGERYYGRGSTDDKGPAVTALMAARAAAQLKIPINITFIRELEEEIGSPNFEHFLATRGNQLQGDSIVISDTIWIASGKPAIPTCLRGLMTFEVTLTTGKKDVHSGLAGGAARNPLAELAGIISECMDPGTGRVLIPHFYDDVTAPSKAELASFATSGFTVEQFMADHELTSLRMRSTEDVMRAIMIEPTFEVHGFTGGYTGPGVKTVVPQTATVKLSTRLVPGQDPARIFKLVKEFITARHQDASVTMEAGLVPYDSGMESPYTKAAARAMEQAFGTAPAFIREGGSIGAAVAFQRHLKAPLPS
jgi:acetylornithine deacetylase/succinyl-diaminopimelate desuccinylase-like protein